MEAIQRYTRVFSFAFKVFGMAKKNPTLLRPVVLNLAAAVPVSLLLAVVYGLTAAGDEGPTLVSKIVLLFGIIALYFIDYVAAGLTVSLVHQQVTQGAATMEQAKEAVKKSLGGILLFATISGMLDILAAYASENDNLVGRIIKHVIYLVWTTAVYVVMPSMIIESLSFGASFKRSKELMAEDPTQVGVGIIGIGTFNYVLGVVCFVLAYMGMNALSAIHPMVGATVFFLMINVYWAVSGYVKITYFTCFYLYALECKRQGKADPAYAPGPLGETLAAA
jgi:hypothetical protein